jgi:hypothetical protein
MRYEAASKTATALSCHEVGLYTLRYARQLSLGVSSRDWLHAHRLWGQ